MRHEDSATAAPRPGRAAFFVFLLLLVLVPALPVAAEEPAGERSVRALLADLRSPLASVRGATETEIVARGSAACITVRTWTRDADLRLRMAAWRILGRIGAQEDMVAARAALLDEQPAVAQAAAGALVALAGTVEAPRAPTVPKGSLSPAAVRSLSLPLARCLDQAPAGAPPAGIFALGEGIIPCLHMICVHPRFTLSEGERALDALAHIGGDEARRTVGKLATHDARHHSAWWRAVNEVGCGPGLEDAHALVVEVARDTLARGRPWIRGIGWRDQVQFFRFIAACPPAEGIEDVRDLLYDLVAWSTRVFPSTMVEIARASLVVSDPTDESLGVLVHAVVPHNRRRRRVEELGSILALVAAFKERTGVKEAVDEIIDEEWSKLPATVQAWALYLQGKTPVEGLRARATKLIRGDGAATVAQRRLGARLWQQPELGLPPVDLIRELLADLDPWMRTTAIGWALRASDSGLMPKAEVAATLTAGLADADDAVLLYVAGSRRVPVSTSARERILTLAVRAPRRTRDRAWRVLETLAGPGDDSSEPAFTRPQAGAALDERIHAAAAFRRDTAD